MPPVRDKILYDDKLDYSEHIAGAFIFKQFKTVVMLKKNYRIDQNDPDLETYKMLLENLYLDKLTQADINVLKSREEEYHNI